MISARERIPVLVEMEDLFTTRGVADSHNALGLLENTMVVGDALDVLRLMPADCVATIHTSPPYNIAKNYKGLRLDRAPLDDYRDFLSAVIREIKRVMRPGGSVFWQTGYTQVELGRGGILPIDMLTHDLFASEPEPMALWDRIIWRYYGGMAFHSKFTNRHETILWYVKPHFNGNVEPQFDVEPVREKAKEYDRRNNLWGRNPGNVWEVDRVAFGSIEQTSHIAVFPEEITEKILRTTTSQGDLVLDPFSGSGTVAKVARSLGRRWIAIEIVPEYAEESVRRLGFQQPGEVWALLSGVIKSEVFGDKPGNLSVQEVARHLTYWAQSADIGTLTAEFDQTVSTVLGNGTSKNRQKAHIWKSYDRKITQRSTIDPVIRADRYLSKDYKNRRNLNGVMRYRTALEILTAAFRLWNETPGDVRAGLVQKIAEQEPETYRLLDGVLVAANLEKRLTPVESIEIGNLGQAKTSNEPVPDSDEEVYQPRMVL